MGTYQLDDEISNLSLTAAEHRAEAIEEVSGLVGNRYRNERATIYALASISAQLEALRLEMRRNR
jgi:hypothetical protein